MTNGHSHQNGHSHPQAASQMAAAASAWLDSLSADQKAKATFEAEGKYFLCIKAGLLAHMHGAAPAVSVEFARKALLSSDRPTFYEVEEACAALPPLA